MAIDIACPSCRAEFEVPEHLAGKRIRCKTCREEFRVEDGTPEYRDEKPRPRRKRAKSPPLIPLLIVGGVLGTCLVVAIVVLGFWSRAAAGRNNVQPFANGPPNRPGIGFDTHTVFPPNPPGAFGRPDQPSQGPILVTLANPRRGDDDPGMGPVYLLDYDWKGKAPKVHDQYVLYVKVPSGIGEAHLHLDENKSTGTIAFHFFPNTDPGQGFDMWIGKLDLTRGKWLYTRYSAVVTLR